MLGKSSKQTYSIILPHGGLHSVKNHQLKTNPRNPTHHRIKVQATHVANCTAAIPTGMAFSGASLPRTQENKEQGEPMLPQSPSSSREGNPSC